MTDTITQETDTISLPTGDMAVHERVAQALETAIGAGRFRAGERLPTHRQLAQQFSVSIGSVTRAIDTLSSRGVVRGEIGRGTFVLGAAPVAESDDGPVDLTINAPPPVVSVEDFDAATRLANRYALALPNGGYVDLSGTPRQRGLIAAWLSDRRVALDADDILLCNGGQQAIHLAFATLAAQSSVILTEGASFPGALAAAASLGLTMAPVAVDGEGMIPEALDAELQRTGARIIYTTPVCQNPLGFETGPERRRAIARVAEARGAYIVEDDIYGIYAAKGRLTYRELLPERVFYLTSFSKCLTPLIRLGALAAPAEFMPALRKRMRAESWGLPPYIAELAAAMIETGLAEKAEAALRIEAHARLEATRRILGIGAVPMPAGAPHLWLPMPPLQAEQFSRRSSEAGVRITPPSMVQVGPEPVAGVRLCIMAPPTIAVLERGLSRLATILQTDEDVVV